MTPEARCPDHSAHDRAIRVHDQRLDAHSERLDEMGRLMVKLTDIEEQNQRRIDSVDARLAALEGRPARRWDSLATAALTALVGGLAGYLMVGAGLA